MKPPSSIAARVAAGRGETFRMRADLAHPKPERISPARALLDSGIAAHERRRREDAAAARVGAQLLAIAARARADRQRAASPKLLKEMLERTRKEMEMLEGTGPAPVLPGSAADRNAQRQLLDRIRSEESTKIARFAARNGVSIAQARIALGLGGGL